MFDAWQNGGQVDGKPVTDERLLAYIKGRRDGFSTDDPSWDEWDNRLTQYGFSIGESKIQLAFQQGKVGAGAVASFYRDQLKNIDKNSEFYRDVAGRAAQWAKSAGGAARGSARRSAAKGLRDQLNSLIYEGQNYDALEKALTDYARREGIITGDQKLTDADATDLRAMFDRGIYSGEDRITFEDFRTAAVGKYKNLSKQLDIQVQLGNQGIEYRDRKNRFLDETLIGLNTVDDRAQYEYAREAWEAEVSDANGNPYAIAAANERYATALGNVADNAGTIISGYSANSSEFIGAINNEIAALTTGSAKGQTVAEMFGANGDLSDIAAGTQALIAATKDIESGKAYYGQAEPGGPLGVQPFPQQSLGSPLGLDPSLQPSISTVAGIRQTVYLMGDEVRATTILDAATGAPVDPNLSPEAIRFGILTGTLEMKEGQTLGYVFVNPATKMTKYGIIDPATGAMVFTETNPWSSDPFSNGGTLQVLTDATERADGNWIPNIAGAYAENYADTIGGAVPLLSDSTVAPKDMLALLESGVPGVAFSPEDVESYKANLIKQQQQLDQRVAERYRQDLTRMGETPRLRPGDETLRANMFSAMQNLTTTTQGLFGDPDLLKDDVYTPPPPPKPPTGTPPPAVPDVALSIPGIGNALNIGNTAPTVTETATGLIPGIGDALTIPKVITTAPKPTTDKKGRAL